MRMWASQVIDAGPAMVCLALFVTGNPTAREHHVIYCTQLARARGHSRSADGMTSQLTVLNKLVAVPHVVRVQNSSIVNAR